jgi:hypothetical protein
MHHTVYALHYGLQLSAQHISVILAADESIDSQGITAILQHGQTLGPAVHLFYRKWFASCRYPASKRKALLRHSIDSRTTSPSFTQLKWWHNLVGPIPLGFAAVATLAVMGLVLLNYKPLPWSLPAQSESDIDTGAEVIPATISRPSTIATSGSLPDIKEGKESLTPTPGILYGSSYVQSNPANTNNVEQELRPRMNVAIAANSFEPITETYTYNVPEALTEDQLRSAALEHFFSLPLNQFIYVNGTYYIADTPEQFHPLFVAFNNDGSVEYQMRQAAICKLDNLTVQITEDAARTIAFNFLTGHHFIEVPERDAKP